MHRIPHLQRMDAKCLPLSKPRYPLTLDQPSHFAHPWGRPIINIHFLLRDKHFAVITEISPGTLKSASLAHKQVQIDSESGSYLARSKIRVIRNQSDRIGEKERFLIIAIVIETRRAFLGIPTCFRLIQSFSFTDQP